MILFKHYILHNIPYISVGNTHAYIQIIKALNGTEPGCQVEFCTVFKIMIYAGVEKKCSFVSVSLKFK